MSFINRQITNLNENYYVLNIHLNKYLNIWSSVEFSSTSTMYKQQKTNNKK